MKTFLPWSRVAWLFLFVAFFSTTSSAQRDTVLFDYDVGTCMVCGDSMDYLSVINDSFTDNTPLAKMVDDVKIVVKAFTCFTGMVYVELNGVMIASQSSSYLCSCSSCDSLVFNVPSGVINKVYNYGGKNVLRITNQFSSTFYVDRVEFIRNFTNRIPKDAGVTGLDTPQGLTCAGSQNFVVRLANFGTTQFTGVDVEWLWNGSSQTGTSYSGTVDTIGGSGSNSVQVSLGSKTLTQGKRDTLVAWTEDPGGVADTANQNDTFTTIITTSFQDTLTVGGSSPDFTSIQDAFDALMEFGVCGPTVIQIRPGTYTGQLHLGMVPGSDTTNTITIQSSTLDSSDVVINFSATSSGSPYVIQLENAANVLFNDLTFEALGTSYSRIFWLYRNIMNVHFTNCYFAGYASTSTSEYRAIFFRTISSSLDVTDNLTIDQCRFVDGSYAIYLTCGSGNPAQGFTLTNNVFTGQYRMCMYLQYHDGSQILNNVVETSSTYSGGYAVYSRYSYGPFVMRENRFLCSSPWTCMYMAYHYGQSSGVGLIANNFFSTNSPYTYGQSNCLNLDDVDYVDFVYNNFYRNRPVSNHVFYMEDCSNLNMWNNSVHNDTTGQIFSITSPSSGSTFSMSDNNNFFNDGNALGTVDGQSISTIADLPAKNGTDSNSVSSDPMYTSATDLHAYNVDMDGNAKADSRVTDDIDGQSRGSDPDIGADQFQLKATDAGITEVKKFVEGYGCYRVVLRNFGADTLKTVDIDWELNGSPQTAISWSGALAKGDTAHVCLDTVTFGLWTAYTIKAWTESPNSSTDSVPGNDTLNGSFHTALSGDYTLGKASSNDFTSFDSAVMALELGGVVDSARFLVQDGTYTEQIEIGTIECAEGKGSVIFQGASSDSSKVILQFGSSSWSTNYVIRLEQATGITFRHLTVRNTSAGSYKTVVRFLDGCRDILFEKNLLYNYDSVSTSSSRAIVYAYTGGSANICFIGNHFRYGSYGIYFQGWYTSYVQGMLIHDNQFRKHMRSSLEIYYIKDLRVTSNHVIQSGTNSDQGFEIWELHGDPIIANNTVICTSDNVYYGMIMGDFYANTGDTMRVYNNFILCESSNQNRGLYIGYVGPCLVSYNTILNRSTDSSGSACALFLDDGEFVLRNNVAVHTMNGYSVYCYDEYSSTPISSDYNNFYSNRSNPVYWDGTTYSSHAAYQTGESKDSNSIFTLPIFEGMYDLHMVGASVNGKGQVVHGINTDIDGDTRDTLSPDMGADEFTPPDRDAGITGFISPGSLFTADTLPVVAIVYNFGLDTLTQVGVAGNVNGDTLTTITYTTKIAPGDTAHVGLGNYDFDQDTSYTFTAWTFSPNGMTDQKSSNDTFMEGPRFTALAGVYTIGGTSPDFATFNEAVHALHMGGISDSVRFRVRTGTYTEQLKLNEIKGVFGRHSIVFESETKDSTDVILTYSTSFSDTNYVVLFNGADDITFRCMTIKPTGSTYSTAFRLVDGCHRITISNNHILGVSTSSTSTNRTLIMNNDEACDSLWIEDNFLQYGSYGIYMYMYRPYSPYGGADDLRIRHNTFRDVYGHYQVYCDWAGEVLIEGNDFLCTGYTYGIPIYVDDTYRSTMILNNTINAPMAQYGIYCYDNNQQGNSYHLIANNFIALTHPSISQYGMYLSYCDSMFVQYNSINLTSSSTNCYGIYTRYGDYSILNNIVDAGSGFAQYMVTTGQVYESDYNNLFSTSSSLVYNGGTTHADLASWQGSGMDSNSISVDPKFFSNTDLHTQDLRFNEMAIPTNLVMKDIDYKDRDSVKPDMGADEFSPPPLDAGISDVITPKMPFQADTQNVVVVLYNYGADTLKSATINWEMNGATQTNYSWTGSLPTGDTSHVTLGSWFFESDSAYDFKTWTSDPNNGTDSDASNDTMELSDQYPALHGVYTLGGGSADFDSFATVIRALERGGVYQWARFRVRNGTYTERMVFSSYVGANTKDALVFESESGDSSDVWINASVAGSGNNYTIYFDSAQGITFRNISITTSGTTYSRVISTNGGNENICFVNCHLLGYNTTSTNSNRSVFYSYASWNNTRNIGFTFDSCHFKYGSFGIYVYGYYGTGSAYSTDITVTNCQFHHPYYMGVNVEYFENMVCRNNLVEFRPTSFYGTAYGIRNYSSNGYDISSNEILRVTYMGVSVQYATNGTKDTNLISNNMIHHSGTGNAYGIYIYSSDPLYIANNNVSLSTSNSSSYCAYIYPQTSAYRHYNNCYYHSGSGYAAYFTSNTSYSDNNNYFSNGTNIIYRSGNYTSFSSYQSATGLDPNGMSIDPDFVSSSDLHVRETDLNEAGRPLPNWVMYDIDGEMRDSTMPDIGADEFEIPAADDAGISGLTGPNAPFAAGTQALYAVIKNYGSDSLKSATINWQVNGGSVSNYSWTGALGTGDEDTVNIGNASFTALTYHTVNLWTTQPNGVSDTVNYNDSFRRQNLIPALDGPYSIGATAADFTSISEAVTVLELAGVLDSVQFNIQSGTYTESVQIDPYPGSMSNRPVCFQSASGTASSVVWKHSSGNNVLYVHGADNIQVKNLTFDTKSKGALRVMEIDDEAINAHVSGCVFDMRNSGTYYYYYRQYGIASFSDNDDSLHIFNNTFKNGHHAIFLTGNSSGYEHGVVIDSNRVNGAIYDCIYVQYLDGVMINRNTITDPWANYSSFAIELTNCSGPCEIGRNDILRTTTGAHGIYLNYVQTSISEKVNVHNNFIALHGGSNSIYGIYNRYGTYTNIWFNSINIYGTNTTSTPVHLYSCSSIDSRNNVFSNEGGGYAFYSTSSSFAQSDYNDYYTSGSNLSYINSSAQTTLTALQSATGKDANSMNVNPVFFSSTDLHTGLVNLDSAAQPITGMDVDIDGDSRNATHPDIGADEFNSLPKNMGVVSVVYPITDCEMDTVKVKVRVFNYGNQPQSNFPVRYTLNGGSVESTTMTDTILPGKSKDIEFSKEEILSTSNTYTLVSWTDLSTEQYRANDSTTLVFENYQTPDSVKNMVPADGTDNMDYPVSLSWLPSQGATMYDVYVWDTTSSKPTSPTYSNLSQISQQISSGLTYGMKYNWQVIAKNSSCETPGLIQQFQMKFLPDLQVTSVSVPSTAFSSTNVTISWTVKNTGMGNASGSWYDRLYLSDDAIFGSDIYLGEYLNPSALSANSDYSNNASVRLPDGISGTYRVFVLTDYRGYVPETNNSNNTARDSASGMAVSLTPPPDLIVSSVIAPTQGFSGSPVYITVTIKNDGTGSTRSGQWYDAFYITQDSTPNSSLTLLKSVQRNGDLDVDSTYTFFTQVTLPNSIEGKRFIVVKTDYTNKEYEHASEGNNTNSDSMEVILTPPPDLVIKNTSIADSVSNRQSMTLTYDAINIGGTATGRSFYTALYLSASPVLNVNNAHYLGRRYHPNLGSGDTSHVSMSVLIPRTINGQYYLFGLADLYNQINEVSGESNNTSDPDTTIVMSPDLTVSGVMVDAVDTTGHNTSIEYDVVNIGPGADFQGTRVDSIYIHTDSNWSSAAKGIGRYLYTPSILAGDTVQVSTSAKIPDGYDGRRYFFVKADGGLQIFENGNDGNNRGVSDSMNVHLAPYPDLIPRLDSFPDSTAAGELIQVQFNVRNDGDTSAKPNWVDRVYLSSDSMFSSSSDLLMLSVARTTSLNKGANYDISNFLSLPSNLTAGNYHLIVVADALGVVYEHFGDTNNVYISPSIFIDGYPPVDLAISCPDIADTMMSGQLYALTYSVTNIGDAKTAAGYWRDGVYLSTDDSLSENDILVTAITRSGDIAKNASYSVNENILIPNGTSGDYYLIVEIDTGDRNVDVDRSNNDSAACDTNSAPKLKRVNLTPPPDLQVTSWTIPSTGTSGQPMTISYTVKNTGTGKTTNGSWVDKVYLSTDYTLDNSDQAIGSKTHYGNLDPDSSYSVSVDYTIPSNKVGNFIVIIKTDVANVEFEHTKENNNIASSITTISQAPPADLIVSQIISPDSVKSGGTINVQWKIKNQGTNPAQGYCYDNVYLSVDKVVDATDLLLGSHQYNISLGQNVETSRSKNYTISGVPLGNYYVLVKTDVRDNITEANDTNNTLNSFNLLNVDVPLITIGVTYQDTLDDNEDLYYRFIVPDSLDGESLLITLDGDSANGNNEMYVRYMELATGSDFDQKHRDPFEGDQEIIIPEADTGTYYLYVTGETSSGSTQPIDIHIRVLPFEIRRVSPISGGEGGEVTLKIEGSKFTEETIFALGQVPELPGGIDEGEFDDYQGSGGAVTLDLNDPTVAFATFDLTGLPLGKQDVYGEKEEPEKPKETAVLTDGFEVIVGGDEDIQVEMQYPSTTRRNVEITITVIFTNKGSNDAVNKRIILNSSAGAPIALDPADLSKNETSIEILLEEEGGPPGRLRPGASGSVKVYAKTSGALGFIIQQQ